MPALIIQTNEDGTVSIAAPAQIPQELLADAETVNSLEEAAQVLQDVLGAEQTGEQAPPAAPGGSGPQGEQPMDPMEQGFRNVRGTPR